MSKIRLSPRQLEAFVAVAECNSFTGAAQRLDLTTSAISSLVAELESAVGVRLFDRSTRRVSLTDSGRLFLPSALGVQRNLRNAEQVAETLDAASPRIVRVAASMVIACSILPPIIAKFQAENPDLEISIIDTGVEWLADRVSVGEADLAIGPDRQTDETVNAENLHRSNWVAWLSPLHPLTKKSELQWRDLQGERVYAIGHDHQRVIKQAMKDLPDSEQIITGQVFENISTALGVAAANLGITLCPAYVAPLAEAFSLEMRNLENPVIARYISLYSPNQRTSSDGANLFVEALRAHFKNNL